MSKIHNIQYKVTVIMSTYNGHKYIKEQLDSLIKQKDVLINLFIRDDGSSDDTVSIVKSYAEKFNDLKVIQEKNIGATASFHRAARLALNVGEETDYYAFCDQDDIWQEKKLITAINIISKKDGNKPNLYFSNLMMMNNNGELQGLLLNNDLVSDSRYNALAAIYTYGCTCVFNRTALEKFCCLDEKLNYIYHDNWLYSICSFLGNVWYDSESYLLYRQTGENVSGQKKTGISVWGQRFLKIFKLSEDKRIYESIALGLLLSFEKELLPEDIILLNQIKNYRHSIVDKMALITSKRMKTSNISKNLCIIGRIILGRL